MTSFASVKGPSDTLGFPPPNRTRAPFELAWRPSRARSTPAFVSSSLYFIIAETSFASDLTGGSAAAFGYISIMNRMVVSPSGWEPPVLTLPRRLAPGGRRSGVGGIDIGSDFIFGAWPAHRGGPSWRCGPPGFIVREP